MKLKIMVLSGLIAVATNVFANITVSDVQVFSGYPWTEVVVGYTITGTDTEMDAEADVIQLTAMDKSANKTYTARSMTGAVRTEGWHVCRWNAASEGAKFSSSNVVFSVSIVRLGVRLWADGPFWAECNVGATSPEESGYYFMWGDTVGCKRNESNDGWVSVANEASISFKSDYCPTYEKNDLELKSAGYIDSTGNLVAEYDAATKHLGPRWRMPTEAEWGALISNCITTWTSYNGVSGLLVTGKGAYAAKSIFLPAAGNGVDSDLRALGWWGVYRSSTHGSDAPQLSWKMDFTSEWVNLDYWGGFPRYSGLSVRPVRAFAQ